MASGKRTPSIAERILAWTDVHITCVGKQNVGAELGTQSFVQEKVTAHKAELECLSLLPDLSPMLPSQLTSTS